MDFSKLWEILEAKLTDQYPIVGTIYMTLMKEYFLQRRFYGWIKAHPEASEREIYLKYVQLRYKVRMHWHRYVIWRSTPWES